MTKEQITELVGLITECVYGDTGNVTLGSSPGCGPVKLQIGFVNKVVMHDGIVITEAPATILSLVGDWVRKQKENDPHSLVQASPGFGGVLIR